jgi:hypothetical protein
MNKIKIVIVATALILASGCKPDHRVVFENFTVSDAKSVAKNMSCRIRLVGTAKLAGVDDDTGMQLTYMKSPYSMFISFHFPKEQSGVVELQTISFWADGSMVNKVTVNQEGKFDNLTEFRKGGVPQVKEENESRASFLIKQVDIPHTELKVSVQAVILIDGKETPQAWEFTLIPYTDEDLRNDQMDTMMSV